ncbi:MAG TPA: YggS family pyridoxal phosphate-dependent enzyme [Firmicutes bacterium]|nr:YggS family pyridoxal phosphate-dependent enzyme [Bacillota bacterium]
MSISQNVKTLLDELRAGNGYGEPVTLVAATKTRTPEEINEAIAAGITDIGENKVQEFRDKFDAVQGGNRHFIGHLQTNKIKYLVGRTYLIQSLDRDELAEELSKRCQRANVTQDVLIEVNIGCEESKSGYPLQEAWAAYERIRGTQGLRVRGFMAMLPLAGGEEELAALVKEMRALFERAKAQDENIRWLSMGMSGDWKLCLRHGANMIRLGTAIFGERHYAPAE